METRALMIIFYASMIILLYKSTYVTSTTQHYLKKMTGYKLTGNVLSLVSRPDMNSVVCAVSCQAPTCKSATYSNTENICMTFQERFYETSITMSVDSNWNILYVIEDTVQHRDWTLVFRGQSLIETSVYDIWTGTGVRDDHPIGEISGECLRLDNVGSCTQHFRSQILDNWEKIDQVRFSLYKNGVEVKYILFDGTDTDKDSWFLQSQVLETSWPDLAPTGPALRYFSFQGYHYPGDAIRSFYTASHNSCRGDRFYTLILEAPYDGCQSYWNIPVPNYPLFMYSPNTGSVTPYTDGFEMADVLAIFVKFK